MLCHSYKNTIRIIDDCADDFDRDVVACTDQFVDIVKVSCMPHG